MPEDVTTWLNAGAPILLLLFVLYFMVIRFRLSGPPAFDLPPDVEKPRGGVRGMMPAWYLGGKITVSPEERRRRDPVLSWVFARFGFSFGPTAGPHLFPARPGYIWTGERELYFRFSAPGVDDLDQFVRLSFDDVEHAEQGPHSSRWGFLNLRIWVNEGGTRCLYDFQVPKSRLTILIDRVRARVKALAEAAAERDAAGRPNKG